MTAKPSHIENIVLGGGEAGKYIAWELAAQGREVIVIERELIGGSCPNIACLPSKNIIQSAKVASHVVRSAEYGVHTSQVTVRMQEVRKRKRDMVDGMIDIHRKRFDIPGLEFVFGEGRFVAPRTIEVRLPSGGVRLITGERIFLNLGTHASIPAVPGLEASEPLTHIDALELGELPAHLIVIGGGYVGVEFAQAFRRLGCAVTIVQRDSQLMPREDADVAESVRTIFEEDGIRVLLNANTSAVERRSRDSVRLHVRLPDDELILEGSHVLVAAGRTPNTRDIGLDLAGVTLDPRGYVQVDDKLQTSAQNVWAMGECAGSPQFTHVALDDFRIVRDNLMGKSRSTRDRLVPYCAFTDPQLGRVGLNEREARDRGIDVRVVSLPMTSVLRARAIGETRGFMKALIDSRSDRVLGFTMLGADAGEVIAVVQMAMMAELPFTALRDAILTHPTMAEGLNVLFGKVIV